MFRFFERPLVLCYIAATLCSVVLNQLWLFGADLDGVAVANRLVSIQLCFVFGVCALWATWVGGYKASFVLLAVIGAVFGFTLLVERSNAIFSIGETFSALWFVPTLESIIGVFFGSALAVTSKFMQRFYTTRRRNNAERADRARAKRESSNSVD